MRIQNFTGKKAAEDGWSTEWRARSRWIVVWSVWLTAACRRSATRTTTVPPTGRASSTLTTAAAAAAEVRRVGR